MRPTSKAAKYTARIMLKDNWAAAIGVAAVGIGAVLVVGFFGSVLSMLSLSYTLMGIPKETVNAVMGTLTTAVEMLGISPLFFGILNYYWNLSVGNKQSAGSIFKYYSSKAAYLKSISVLISLAWRTLLVAIPSFIPFAYFYAALNEVISVGTAESGNETALYFICGATAVLGLLIVVLFLTRYFPLIPLIFSNEDMSVSDAIKLSKIISSGNRTMFFYMMISFSGWVLISLLAIPMVYTLPFFAVTFCVFSRFAINDYILTETEKKSQGAPISLEQISEN